VIDDERHNNPDQQQDDSNIDNTNLTAPLEDYYQQGMGQLQMGAYEEAVITFSKAVRLALGDLAEIYLQRGIAYSYLNDWDNALKDFNQALQINPYFADAYNERGTVWRFMGEYAYALTDYGAALRIEPTLAEAYYNRAITHEEQEQYTESEADFSAAIEHNRTIAPAFEGRGRIRAQLRDYEGAIADLERYLRMGGGRDYDNHSEIQSFIIVLRLRRWWARLLGLRRKKPSKNT
jgi:tetratricopeptide (TPR) repeat protein